MRTALGPEITAWLEDASVIEVMLNPDGRLWVDRLGAGIADTGKGMSAADGERIIRLVAHHVGAEVHAKAPRVSAELPETGERFEGLLPPVTTTFTPSSDHNWVATEDGRETWVVPSVSDSCNFSVAPWRVTDKGT